MGQATDVNLVSDSHHSDHSTGSSDHRIAPGKRTRSERLRHRKGKDEPAGDVRPARDYVLALTSSDPLPDDRGTRLTVAGGSLDLPGLEHARFTAQDGRGERHAVQVVSIKPQVVILACAGVLPARFADAAGAHVVAHLPALRVRTESDGSVTAVPVERPRRAPGQPFDYLDELRGGGAADGKPAGDHRLPARYLEGSVLLVPGGEFRNIQRRQVAIQVGLADLASGHDKPPAGLIRERARAHVVVAERRHPIDIVAMTANATIGLSSLTREELTGEGPGGAVRGFVHVPELVLGPDAGDEVNADGSIGADDLDALEA